ncbi:Uncharacterised protein [Mycobacteroides abscessus subsp. abscessus]|nr:Uncharacterised protein [Mycobacteroides abscessus subsp. abscessus]
MRDARVRAAVRLAAKLGATINELYSVQNAVDTGWSAGAEEIDISRSLLAALDKGYAELNGGAAPPQARRLMVVLGILWPDVVADCEREERESQRQSETACPVKGHEALADLYDTVADLCEAMADLCERTGVTVKVSKRM